MIRSFLLKKIYFAAFASFFFLRLFSSPCFSAGQAPDKIEVYKAIVKYASFWNTSEAEILSAYSYNEADGAAKDNAFKLLKERFSEKSVEYETFVKFSEGLPVLFMTLTANEKAFFSASKFDFSSLRKTVKLIAASSKYLLNNAKGSLALKSLLVTALFIINSEEAYYDSKSRSSLLAKMISIACQNICLDAIIKILASSEFDEKLLLDLYVTADFIEKKKPAFALAAEEERKQLVLAINKAASLNAAPGDLDIFAPEVFMAAAAEIKKSPFALKVVRLYADEGIRQINEIFSSISAALKLPYHEASVEMNKVNDRLCSHGYNNFFAAVGAPNFLRMHDQITKNYVLFDFVKISAALKAYKLKFNAFPASLDDIAKNFAGVSVPRDRFSGRNYDYRLISSGAFVLISPGPDCKIGTRIEEISTIISLQKNNGLDDLILTESGSLTK